MKSVLMFSKGMDHFTTMISSYLYHVNVSYSDDDQPANSTESNELRSFLFRSDLATEILSMVFDFTTMVHLFQCTQYNSNKFTTFSL